MGPFCDTGVALKLIVPEPLSDEMLSFVKKRGVPVLVTRLIELEMETALNAMAFRDHITTAQLATAKTLLTEMTKEGKFVSSDLRQLKAAKLAGLKPLDLSKP